MTPGQKAHQTRYFKIARILAKAIADLPKGADSADVLLLWEHTTGSRQQLADAYTVMDTEPRRFEDHQLWHPRLRALRNNTDLGPKLFALWS